MCKKGKFSFLGAEEVPSNGDHIAEVDFFLDEFIREGLVLFQGLY